MSPKDGITAMPDDSTRELVPLRQEAMRRIDGHMNSMSRIVLESNRSDASRDALLAHVKAVEELASELPNLFPQGSTAPSSRAKLEVWSESASFKAAAATFRVKVEKFAEVARSGDSERMKAAYKELDFGQACNDCHAAFRKDEGTAPAAGEPRKRDR
jgi:cytochrome c556